MDSILGERRLSLRGIRPFFAQIKVFNNRKLSYWPHFTLYKYYVHGNHTHIYFIYRMDEEDESQKCK